MRKSALLPVLLLLALISCRNQEKAANAGTAINFRPFTSATEFSSISGLDNILADKPQVFVLPADHVQQVTAKQGLRITVDPGKLQTADGMAIAGTIELTVKEMQTANGMLMNNCPTVCDGKLLESGGSYFVGMRSSGKEVRVKKGQTITMQFPKIGEKDMELFYGQRDQAGIMNWKPVQKRLTAKKEKNEGIDKDALQPVAGSFASARISLQNNAYEKYYSRLVFDKYEDSVLRLRRSWVRQNFKKVTQEDIRKVMEAPFRMPAVIFNKMSFDYTMSYRNCFNGAAWVLSEAYKNHSYTSFQQKDSDMITYYRDSIFPGAKTTYGNIALRTGNTDDIDMAVDTATDVKGSKIKKNTNGSANISIRYFDPVEIENLGWINCDRFYNSTEGVSPVFTLNVNGAVPPAIGVYTIFPDMNSLLSVKLTTNGNAACAVFQNLPLNKEVELLIYSKINNRFVQCKRKIVVTRGMVIPVDFTAVSDDQVKKIFLKQPPGV